MVVPIAAAIGIAVGSMIGVEATRELLNNVVWTLIPVKQYEPADSLDLLHRKLIDKEDYITVMRQNGYSEKKAESLYTASYRLIEMGDLIRLKWRGLINEEEFLKRASKTRATKDDIELIEEVSRYFPSPSDLITMAVREVFTPDIVETFQLDADLPEQFLELAGKVGLSEEIATWSWRAHWLLPSLSNGFEMFHRRIISKEQLALLMRTQDIMPFWRDKLIQLSYRPLTRVDVRRMYDLGVLDRKGVYQNYLDYGYSPKNAELMTEFTERYILPTERNLTKTQIQRSFKIGEFNKEETIAALMILGYSEITAEFVVVLWEHEIAEEYIDDRIDVLTTQVVDGIITVDEFNTKLADLELPVARLEKVLVNVQHRLLKAQQLPSKEDLLKFLAANIIDESLFADYMARRGFRDIDINLYLKLVQQGD